MRKDLLKIPERKPTLEDLKEELNEPMETKFDSGELAQDILDVAKEKGLVGKIFPPKTKGNNTDKHILVVGSKKRIE